MPKPKLAVTRSALTKKDIRRRRYFKKYKTIGIALYGRPFYHRWHCYPICQNCLSK